MLLLMKKLSWSLIQSLKTKARTPAVSSRKKMIPRNTENCNGKKKEKKHAQFSEFIIPRPWGWLRNLRNENRFLLSWWGKRTNLSRKEFSRSAPMQPANPRMNITPPTTRKSQTGSKPPRSVMEEMLERTPWSEQKERERRVKSGQRNILRTLSLPQTLPRLIKLNILWKGMYLEGFQNTFPQSWAGWHDEPRQMITLQGAIL